MIFSVVLNVVLFVAVVVLAHKNAQYRELIEDMLNGYRKNAEATQDIVKKLEVRDEEGSA